MVRKGSRSSISDSSSQGSNSTQGKLSARVDVENVDQGVLPLLEKLRATMDTVVARLGMLENAYFEHTRGPAGTGVVGSTGFQTPSSLMQSAVCAGGLSLDAARGGIVPSAHKPNVRADPSPQTVVDYADNPPCGDAPPIQLFKPGAAVDLDGDVFALEGHGDADVKLDGAKTPPSDDGAEAPPPSFAIFDDDKPVLRIQAFLRRVFVRFRLQKDCGPSALEDNNPISLIF